MALRLVTGFGHRSTAGWVTGNAGNRFADALSGSLAIVQAGGRDWLQVSPSAAVESLRWTTDTLGTSQNRALLAFRLRFPTTVPTVQILAQFTGAGALDAIFGVDASDRLTFGFEGGTIVTGPTLSPDTDYWVECHVDVSANPQVLDWYVDGVAQTQITRGQAATTISTLNLGTTNSETWTALFSDVLVWTDTADITPFPVGSHRVVEVSVDPGGTLVLTGTAANWNVFTGATPTLAAWNATTARDRVDEIPVNIGSSQDGFAQINIAASDFVRMPMTAPTLAAGETVTGIRAEVVGWAASTTATNIRLDDYNGSSAATFFALGDPNFDNSATVPAWVCKMLTTSRYDTQGELDAFCIDVGYGTDANPDAGIHAAWAAVAIKLSTGVTGAATGDYAFSGTATGEKTVQGVGLGAYAFTGAANGARETQGSGLGSYAFSGTATGTRETQGSASGVYTFSGVATGTRESLGSGLGAYDYVGTATGTGTSEKLGSATGSYDFVGSATGVKLVWVRHFDGVDDRIVTDPGAVASMTNPPVTQVSLVKFDSVHAGGLIWPFSSEGSLLHVNNFSDGNIWVEVGGGGNRDTVSYTEDVWLLIVVSKAGGASGAVRAHRYNFDTETWVHSNHGTLGDGNAKTVSVIDHGRLFSTDFLEGSLAVQATYDVVLTDGEVESLLDGLQAFIDLDPVALWSFNQADETTDVLDLTGGGADQNNRVGTDAVLEALDFDFTLAANEVEGSATGDYTFTGTATGETTKVGSGLGAYGFTGQASGVREVAGQALGAYTFSGTGSGQREVLGAGSGTYTFQGSATGEVAGHVMGSATGAFTFTGQASGVRTTHGSGLGAYEFSGVATGARTTFGSAQGVYTFAGVASGARETLGVALGAYVFTGHATGFNLGPEAPSTGPIRLGSVVGAGPSGAVQSALVGSVAGSGPGGSVGPDRGGSVAVQDRGGVTAWP